MQIAIRKSNFFYVGLILFLGFVSCDSNRIYDSYQSVENNRWNQEIPVEFKIGITDTISMNNLFVNIRNNSDYQYSNLFLITHINFPSGVKVVDTLQYEMADKNGKFLGSGISEVKNSKLFLKEHIVFPVSGEYQVLIYQAMRKNGSVEGIKELEGVTDVGFRIEKSE